MRSFSSASAVNSGRVLLWPVEPSVIGYEKVFTYPGIWLSYGNTVFYTVAGTAINIVMTLLAAYPLSRRDLPFKGPLRVTLHLFFLHPWSMVLQCFWPQSICYVRV